jgi:hypothetical protein
VAHDTDIKCNGVIMTNVKQVQAVRMKMAERAQQKMELHFPGWPDFWVWSRKRDAGYISVPRILPIAMQAIDDHATKGSPGGHTLFCLWARSPDHVLVTIEHPATFAAEAGFRGTRAVDTWRKRMKVLRDLGFIVPKKGPSGDFHHVMLINPIAGVERMYQNGKVHVDLYDRFLGRLVDTGAYGQLNAFKAAWQAERDAAAVAAAVPPPPPSQSGAGDEATKT